MADPRRLFQSKDAEAAALYAKQTGASEDVYPVLVDEAGNLCVNMTVGTVSLSSTGTTITNAVGNPVNVSLTSTKVTIESSGGLTVTPSTTASTITNAVGNPVNVSLTSTAVTASLTSTAVSVTNSVSTIEIVGRTLTGTTISFNATTSTVTTAGTNRQKVYAVSVTTTATTSSVISFVNGTYGGMVLWKAVLQAPSGANAGLNLAVTPPAYLFATASATLLRMNLTNAIPVEVSLSYFDEA